MKSKITYGWEYLTPDNPYALHDTTIRRDTLSDFFKNQRTPFLHLVANHFDVAGKLVDVRRSFVKEGKLSEYFLDPLENEMEKVPRKFHEELFCYNLQCGVMEQVGLCIKATFIVGGQIFYRECVGEFRDGIAQTTWTKAVGIDNNVPVTDKEAETLEALHLNFIFND